MPLGPGKAATGDNHGSKILPRETIAVLWVSAPHFDPYLGGGLQTGSVAQVTGGGTVSLGTAPGAITKDRVVLVKLIPPGDTTPPEVFNLAPTNGASLLANLPLAISATVTRRPPSET